VLLGNKGALTLALVVVTMITVRIQTPSPRSGPVVKIGLVSGRSTSEEAPSS